jgi:hypothetical protein
MAPAVLLSLPLLPDIPGELHLHVPGEDSTRPLRLRHGPVRPFCGKAVKEFLEITWNTFYSTIDQTQISSVPQIQLAR